MLKFEQIPADMRVALLAYAKANGRTWRSKLFADRMSSRPEVTGELRACVNAYGSALYDIKLPQPYRKSKSESDA